MKHLKLFEGYFSDELYDELNRDQYGSFLQGHDRLRLPIKESNIIKEVLRSYGYEVFEYKDIEYAQLTAYYLTRQVMIQCFSDEYWTMSYITDDEVIEDQHWFFLCDGIEGLLKCLQDKAFKKLRKTGSKLYESIDEVGYELVTLRECANLHKLHVSERDFDKISKALLDKSIYLSRPLKPLNSANQTLWNKHQQYLLNGIESNDVGDDSIGRRLYISYYEDDWYLLVYYDEEEVFYYKCDQLEGLLNCIKDKI